ncbi:MAG TPA: hypothetical protein VJ728_06835 [Candidatus Binataceae bacterium]|nr:hypothetical protein [Candidatus Binataceae bacterium]
MPGIRVVNFYIHNTGPGCSDSDRPCVGFDDNKYANQLDFEDSSQGADGVQLINNTVKWCGGHNCLQVHHDTGNVVVEGNKVGPGCVHSCIDVKGIGRPEAPAVVSFNTATCGESAELCGCEVNHTCGKAQNPAFYTENVYSPSEVVTFYGNVAYDTGIGFQDCRGGCSNDSGCAMDVNYYNNTVYIARTIPNSYGLYADITCAGPASSGPQRITLRNNIFDGASNYSVFVGTGFSAVSEDYNNIGGMQGSPGFKINGSARKGPHDLSNVDPRYVNVAAHDFRLLHGSPCIDAGLTMLTDGLRNLGAY